MAVALVSAIVERLGSLASSEFKLTVTVKKEVQKLARKFRTIRAVLNDAEKRQLKEEAVKLWFENLEGVSYEIDDVLDEWNTVMIKSEIGKQQKEFDEEEKAETSTTKKRKVRHFTSNFNSSVLDRFQHRNIAHKIKDLNEKLDEIIKEKQMFGFKVSGPIEEVFERQKTTSYVDVSEILGRDKVKNDLVSILLGKGTEKEKHPHVISLLGMGGIGKTTLAQLAYNDKEVQAHFEIKVWVCVSDPFDQCKVGKEILESVEPQSLNLTALQSQLNRICDNVRGKKLFLVFDDVWTEDYEMWQPFKDALKSCCSRGSRILVTTRKDQVAKMMESANTIKLNELSEEDCWCVFSKIAFFDKDPQECEQLEEFGRQISKKCKGLPLAAKTLGSLMRFKKSREEWRYVSNNNLWEFEDVERGLFGPLLLSYYDLSSPLKRCFSYCAVFPKDHIFNVDKLVEMWIAHGFVESKGNMEVEIKAREYFENLVIRSFFQKCKKDVLIDNFVLSTMSTSTMYKMHDIVHDFAQSITKAHHWGYSKASQFPPSADISKNLRTVIFFNQCDYNMSNLVQNFSSLRVLTLTTGMKIPDTIGNLIHLRYLDLEKDFSRGKWVLPETICNLCNLQFLMVGNTISMLPQKIGKLINLRLLTGDQLVIPKGIGRLTSLRTLSRVLISDEDGKRSEFEGLKNLNHLRYLSLSFGELLFPPSDRRRTESDLSIFNALEPPQNLEKLHIRNYRGTTMSPIWLASLTNLKELCLYSAAELMSLPPLGKILPCLELLTISSRWNGRLKKVGVEFLGIESKNKKEDMKIFPNLKYLTFYGLRKWEEWTGGSREGGKEDEDGITIMPHLQTLNILYCFKLKSLPDFLRTTPLKKLEIKGCPIIMKRCRRETGEDWHNISHIPIIKLADDPYDMTRYSEASSDSDTDWGMNNDLSVILSNSGKTHNDTVSNGFLKGMLMKSSNLRVSKSERINGPLSWTDSGPQGTFVGVYVCMMVMEELRLHVLSMTNFFAILKDMQLNIRAYRKMSSKRLSYQLKKAFSPLLISNGLVSHRQSTEHNANMENMESVREELQSLHPHDSQIVVLKHKIWRVKGLIQVSRSIGDAYLKKAEFNREPLLPRFRLAEPFLKSVRSSEPSISVHKLHPEDQFLIFASDGLWEHLSNQEAVNIVVNYPLYGIARRLVKAALQEAAKKREMRYSDLKTIDRGVRRHFHDDITNDSI